jgi:3-deoxy-7-phosphoheptulonate synthase / chorismate mutase
LSPIDREPRELLALRRRIDELNLQLLRLLEQRGQVVAAVLALKHGCGMSPYDPEREQAMLNSLCAQSHGPYTCAQIVKAFSSIFEISRALGGPGA